MMGEVKQNFGIYKKINNIILVMWTINKWNQNKNIFLLEYSL